MRSPVLIVCLALAAGAVAEEKSKPKAVVKPVDESSPAMAQTDSENTDETAIAADAREKTNKAKTRAQDYNSSRSNTTMVAGESQHDALEPDAAGRGRR